MDVSRIVCAVTTDMEAELAECFHKAYGLLAVVQDVCRHGSCSFSCRQKNLFQQSKGVGVCAAKERATPAHTPTSRLCGLLYIEIESNLC